MKAQIILTEEDVKRALREYVERAGWRVSGPISVNYSPGDVRDPSQVTASIYVESPAARG